ncbi:MAG TPA: DUF302 domain-containing protein [Candidatus Acidoferrum sp.]|jgi:uncharacterized protein (DUF302 family)/uncharacterized membrane protein YidH (DUF202 family)|nr:DUF302 domain-containing protein [Candidatus Acidoferrum sp.]
MDAPTQTPRRADLRDYLAAERTFLAWIRTGLALMGFGFVVARFGLFLQQIRLVEHLPSPPSCGLSLWFGTALIAVGVVVNLSSAWRHVRLVRELDRGAPESSYSFTQAVATALFLALVGLAMAIYLLSVRSSANLISEINLTSQIHLTSKINEEIPMPAATNPTTNKGIIDKPSNHSVEQTVEKLKTILQSKGVTLFAVVDHSGEAEKVEMKMRPTKLLIFGSPKAGTPLMLAASSIAIDLPLKILVWEDAQGKVWVSYNSPEYLKDRHGLPPDLLQNIAVVETLAAKAAE